MAKQTKQALADALMRLSQTKPLNKITITDLTEDCKISRMTFYYHFRDIYDLVGWMCLEEGSRAVGSCKDYDTWEEGFRSACQLALENRAFVEAVCRWVQHEQIEDYLYRVLYQPVWEVVQGQTERASIPETEKKRMTEFFTLAFLGTALMWVKKGFRESPEELTQGLSMLVNGQIALAIRNYRFGGLKVQD